MDEFQERLAALGLAALSNFGFALAGGYALQAHGLVNRLSEDIDLFTDRWDPQDFERAVEAVSRRLQSDQLEFAIVRRGETFARFQVTDPQSGRTGLIDLAADFRHREPVRLEIGPVLSEDDAVASKVAATFSRGEARDYLDLAEVLASQRYGKDELISLAARADAGFSLHMFSDALAGVDRFPDEEFQRYGVSSDKSRELGRP
jgi:predicted nucleotidyltransferase component of viral defense system